MSGPDGRLVATFLAVTFAVALGIAAFVAALQYIVRAAIWYR